MNKKEEMKSAGENKTNGPAVLKRLIAYILKNYKCMEKIFLIISKLGF